MSTCEQTINGQVFEVTVGPFTITGMPICGTEQGTYTDERSFVVRKGSGPATVTAHSIPYLSEEELPACWSLSGGNGTSKLVRTVNLSQPGTTVITATAGDTSKKLRITVVEVGDISLSNTEMPADGASSITAYSSLSPGGRTLEWSLLCDETESSISSSGLISAGTRGGTAIVRAADSELPHCFKEATISLVKICDVGFDTVCLIAESSRTVRAVASVAPAGRTVIWSIQGNNRECTIDPATGVITPGSETGTITVRATDSVFSSVYAQASIEICSQCMEDAPVKINRVKLDSKRVVCQGEDVTATLYLTGYCCKGYEYDGPTTMSVTLPSSSGKHIEELASVEVCGVILRAKAPDYTVVSVNNMTFCPPRIPPDNKSQAEARAIICPNDRTLKWSIVEGQNNPHASISSSGDMAIIKAKTASGKVTVRAADSENADCYVERTLLVEESAICHGCITPLYLSATDSCEGEPYRNKSESVGLRSAAP